MAGCCFTRTARGLPGSTAQPARSPDGDQVRPLSPSMASCTVNPRSVTHRTMKRVLFWRGDRSSARSRAEVRSSPHHPGLPNCSPPPHLTCCNWQPASDTTLLCCAGSSTGHRLAKSDRTDRWHLLGRSHSSGTPTGPSPSTAQASLVFPPNGPTATAPNGKRGDGVQKGNCQCAGGRGEAHRIVETVMRPSAAIIAPPVSLRISLEVHAQHVTNP